MVRDSGRDVQKRTKAEPGSWPHHRAAHPEERLANPIDRTSPDEYPGDFSRFVVSTRRAYHEETDHRSVSERLVGAGRLELVVHTRDAPYTKDSTGDYWAYRVSPGSG